MAGRTRGDDEGVVARIARLLAAFDDDEPELGIERLADAAGLPRSTAHRLATELARHGLLAKTAPGTFCVGTRLWEVGELSPLSSRLREYAFPILERMYEATGENVHLAVLAGNSPQTAEALYVVKVSGETSIPTLSRTGGRLPLHTTGVGKALLMGRDDEWLAQYFTRRLERETTFSIVDEQRLRADLAESRVRGYAATRQEMTLGNFSVAVPLPGIPGLPAAAVGIVSHIGRSSESRLAPIVRRAARDIAAAVGPRLARR
ncbi:IclR family transcriptional regulator [Gryllotalpicola koreensis]|uniref:IclR family transcriptional regulator n=1 Tax=Gryllotalpicola koreensis TaxID=993086 RepID=A0ABP8A0Y7_9MICO